MSLHRLLVPVLAIFATLAIAAGEPTFTDVFTAGESGFESIRIPSVVVTVKGTVLAFAEARAVASDQAQNKMVMKRSADGGQTWGALQIIHDDGTNSLNNPTAVVEQATGRVLLMYQRIPGHLKEGSTNIATGFEGPDVYRNYLVHSDDGGATWSPITDVTELRDPSCNASILRWSFGDGEGKGRILYSGPDSTQRENGTVHLSLDDGATWPVSKVLWPGGFAYSVLTRLPDGTVGCLFEADGTKRIVFARFSTPWLNDSDVAPKSAMRHEFQGAQ